MYSLGNLLSGDMVCNCIFYKCPLYRFYGTRCICEIASRSLFQPKMQQILFIGRALPRPAGGTYSTPNTS